MAFRLVHTKYDQATERAYIELRDEDDDGGQMFAIAIFSFKTRSSLSRQQIEQDVSRKARHVFRRAMAAL
jgi:hypothetical protein